MFQGAPNWHLHGFEFLTLFDVSSSVCATPTGIRGVTAKRKNQHQQNLVAFDQLLSHFREPIEGFFNEVQNTGRNLKRLLRKRFQDSVLM